MQLALSLRRRDLAAGQRWFRRFAQFEISRTVPTFSSELTNFRLVSALTRTLTDGPSATDVHVQFKPDCDNCVALLVPPSVVK